MFIVLLALSGAFTVLHDATSLGPGTVSDSANGTTVVSIQGFHFQGEGSEKKPARLVAANEDATTQWKYEPDGSTSWFYDVDPLPNETLLVTATAPGTTHVYEYDPETGERLWVEEFAFQDTHDVDRINDDELLIANMRATEDGVSNDRILVYNRTMGEMVWEWKFRDHYPNSTDGGFSEDWSHVNDVDKIGAGEYLVSPRNFDQVIVVNRSTDAITEKLGRDGNHEILDEQHNPDYLETDSGEPVILVADSENDRVVEYTKQDGEWVKTWVVTGFNWPRDADRLSNGNTLITDTLNHRVVEVTPEGEVVWEYYATWAPYDSERISNGGGSSGPTMHDQGVAGTFNVSGGADETLSDSDKQHWLERAVAGTPISEPISAALDRYKHVIPWVKPFWMSSTSFTLALFGGIWLLGWGVVEGVWLYRDRRREE